MTALAPVSVRPGAAASIIYDTRVRWGQVTYTVRQDEQVISQGRLRGKEDSFDLPEVPGTFHVSISYHWNGWMSGGNAEGSDYFRVKVET